MKRSAKREGTVGDEVKDVPKKSRGRKKEIILPVDADSNAGVEVIIRKKALGEAPEEHHFILSDGRKLKSLLELADAVHEMSDDMFRSHVNDARNDFSNWIKDIFEEPILADELKRVGDRSRTEISLLRYLLKEMQDKEDVKRGG
jgi:hypothetical protein